MGRKSRNHRPPHQSQAIPPGAASINPNREAQARAQQENQIRSRVEGVAAQIFTDTSSSYLGRSDLDQDDERFDEAVQKIAERSIDAALILGRELWGITAKRQKPPQAPKRRPRVITDDDNGGEEQES